MDHREQIISFIRAKGPSVPTQVAQSVGIDSIFASAYLSELVSKGRVKISKLKIGGGSPLYYLPEQQNKLESFSGELSDKNKQAYEAIKQKKILKDSDLEPILRVSLRAIKDFAIPITVNNELFWRWYAITNEQVGEMLNPKPKVKVETKKVEKEKPIKQEAKTIEKKETKQEKVTKEKPKRIIDPNTDNFYQEVAKYFANNKVKILEEEIIRKNSEIRFIVEMATPMGNMKFYCKARNKKKSNDTDLAASLLEGKMKNLPTIYLTTGEVTKKALENLSNYPGLTVKQI